MLSRDKIYKIDFFSSLDSTSLVFFQKCFHHNVLQHLDQGYIFRVWSRLILIQIICQQQKPLFLSYILHAVQHEYNYRFPNRI